MLHISPHHPPWLDLSNCTWRRAQVMKLFILQLSLTSCHLYPFDLNIPLSTLFSNTLSLCSSLNVTDQVSRTYQITGKIVVLYVLIFTFLDTRRKDKRF
jgi:hypothetical protein